MQLQRENTLIKYRKKKDYHCGAVGYGCSLLTSDKAQMLYDKYEIDITYLLTGNKPDFDNHLRQLWLTASRVEKKLILARLISYVEEML